MPTPVAPSAAQTWLGLEGELVALMGAGHVVTDPARTLFFSTDIYASGLQAVAVIAPGSVDELAGAVRLCTAAGLAVIPRGGGFSYTQAYTPAVAGAVMVDLRRLDRIIEINAEDMTVTVECGCTWAKLYEALKDRGLRTPCFGPLSGHRATVGGGLAQGSFFLGSTQYGTSADSVLAVEVVLADGTVLATGSAAGPSGSSPHFRNYGPDLTGLFLQDGGAFGFKTKATLKLIAFPAHNRFATFSFEKRNQAIGALSAIARAGLAAECYIWDPIFGKRAQGATSFVDKLRYVRQVALAGRNPIAGLLHAARMAIRGGSAFAGKANLLHVTIDDVSDAGCAAKLAMVQALGVEHGGRPFEPAAPRAMRAHPFHDFALQAQRNAQARSLPSHGLFPHSAIQAANSAMEAVLAEHQELMQAHGVTAGAIFVGVGAQTVCIEPLLYWTDERLAHHDRLAERSDVEALNASSSPTLAGQAVQVVRTALIAAFARQGAAHAQIGKLYPYRATRRPETFALLQQIKAVVDPRGLVNPGVIGLSPPVGAPATEGASTETPGSSG